MKVTYYLVFFLFITNGLIAQRKDSSGTKYTPYELMSSFYNDNFRPFKKGNVYLGAAFSLQNRKLTNSSNILVNVVDGERLNYDLLLGTGYFIGEYGMVGLDIKYYQSKFQGDVIQQPDTVQSNTITRGFSLTPNFRTAIPLTRNERLSFFVVMGATVGSSNSLTRNITNPDVVDKVYSEDINFRLGVSPGVTFFAIESFAFEIQLDLLGYELSVSDKRTNEGPESRVINQSVDFKINLLSLQLGLAYYFNTKK
ncbi:hypothetical protein [Fulvivirga sedimenti]|uniref:Outer membrane protein beta-barrel domain-containing protein n=1 Tax=Fulvivirga sedimenti TaxID=2879465 RepID=A0A9X1HJV7_9BACT|nr:hypothetical protein [Fulvivirga sedimenti]MCA6073468.1 hypothetical protein [Fulvivirga sedimenti]